VNIKLMLISRLQWLLWVSLWLSPFHITTADTYAVDALHTRVAFDISHAGFSNTIGTFSAIEGELQFNESDWSQSKLEIKIPLKTLDLGDESWQQKMLSKAFFDAENFPIAYFTSNKIEKQDETHGLIYGQLTLRNVSVPVVLTMQLNAVKRHPLSFKKTIGASAHTKLSRKAFGMTSWQNLIGDEVRIKIEFEATRSRTDTNSADKELDDATKK
jgi:polyisoprenoid-binding protein YceI